jgi:hypothetical protein
VKRVSGGSPRTAGHPRSLELIALSGLLVAQLYLFSRPIHAATNYDEDVYLAAVNALRHGQALGSQVFAAQFPGFYDLLRGLSYIAGVGIVNLRAALLGVVCLGSIGGWLVGRRVGGVAGGLLVPAMLTIAPPLDLFGSQVIADTPCLSLMLLSLGLSTLSGPVAALSAGAIFGAALAVKPTALIVLPALAWFSRTSWIPTLSGAIAVFGIDLLLHADALGALWSSDITYHRRAGSTPNVIPNPHHQILEQIPRTTPFFVLALLACAVTVVGGRRALTRLWPLWLSVGLSVLLLLTYKPLHYNHLIVFPFTLAVAAGASLALGTELVESRRLRAGLLGVIALALVAGWIQQLHRVDQDRPSQPLADVRAAHALERLTPSSSLVVDDRPIIAFLAHRQVVGSLVDTAYLRFETGSLTDAKVIRDLKPAAAVVISRSLRSRPKIVAYLERHDRLAYAEGGVRIYVRADRP